MINSKSVKDVIDSIPFKPRFQSTVAPTSGPNAQLLQVCSNSLAELQALMAEAVKAYDTYKFASTSASVANAFVIQSNYTMGNYLQNGIRQGDTYAARLYSEIERVTDASKIEYIKMVYPINATKDFGPVTPAVAKFQQDLIRIEGLAAAIKKEAQKDTTNTTVTNSSNIGKPELEKLVLQKILFEIELYLILPGGEKVVMHQYVSQILYTRMFEEMSLPIYSIMMSVPQNIQKAIHSHFQNIKWFITVKAKPKLLEENNKYVIPEVIYDNAQLIAIDPEEETPTSDSSNIDSATPIYPIKIDFIPFKDNSLNSVVKARVFNNVKLLDVIMTLASELHAEYQARSTNTSDEVKFSISPPDNTQTYEQILVEPGSFTDVIYTLQKKYGIYLTGARVSFDSIQSARDKTTGKIKTTTTVTILDKGGIAPATNSLKDVIVELVDGKAVSNAAYDSGYTINTVTNTVIIRTMQPYSVIRNNSDSLTTGESVRVMQASSNDHSVSNCDNTVSDTNTQKVYWSKYDNPYALTQLQNSIREKALTIHAEIRDVNTFMYTDNFNYSLKFYGKDEELFSGTYRLSAIRFMLSNKVPGFLDNVESTGIFTFTNMPPLRINGTEVARSTYGEKLSEAGIANSSSGVARIEGGGLSGSGQTASANPGPFPTNFKGKQDLYGVLVPAQIPDSFKMSSKVKFSDTYITKDSSDFKKANGLATNFAYFINAQRFSNEVLEPLIGIFGALGTGKLNSFYRYGIPGGGSKTSQHLIALAADAVWGGAPGDPLAMAFFKIINSGLVFDQLILEGNGSGWRWIHVGKQMNGVNRGNILIAENAVAGQYKKVNISKLKTGTDLSWATWKKFVY
jgi:hypothetical protein